MNLQQFAALKPGDKISNPMGNSAGVVASVSDSGVRVKWGASTMEFFYSVNSTAWMHWSMVEARECTAGPCYREDCRRSDQCLGGDYNKLG